MAEQNIMENVIKLSLSPFFLWLDLNEYKYFQ